LGDYQSALRFYDVSSYTSSNGLYYPSLLRNLSIRLSSGDYGIETERLLSKAESLMPSSQQIKYMKIDLFMGKQDYDSATALCYDFLSKRADNAKIAEILAMIDFSKDSLDSALHKINSYEASYGVEYSLYSVKREILARKNLYDSLLSYNLRVSQLYPENLSLLADLANVNAAMGQDSVAFALWNYIESEDPNSLEFLFQSNQFYSSRRYADNTISTSLKLLSSPYIIPQAKEEIFHNIFLSFDISKDTSHLSRLDSSLFEVALSESDTTIVKELVLGYYFYRSNYDKSLQILDSTISMFPGNYVSYLQKANLLNTIGQLNSALDFLESSATLFPHKPNFVLYKAELLKENVSEDSAIKYVKSAIKSETVDSTKTHYLSYIADIYYKQGKEKLAFKTYESSLKLTPEDPLTLNNYAYFLALSDTNMEKALVMSHKCNSIVKNNATYLDTEAYILYKLGMYSEAKQLMDLAFSQDSEDFSDEFYLHYADILKALGNGILAKSFYQKALDAGADSGLISERLKSLE